MSDMSGRRGVTTSGVRPGEDLLDDPVVRADRRRRLFAAMADAGVDALVLGRPADVAFATGARQLWTAGARPFGPLCVAVAATERTHLLSVWDDGVPPEVGHEDLFGLTWNPARLAAALSAIPGLADARRVGTTSSTPGFPRLLAGAAPGAEVVDGGAALWAARLPKSPAEVERIVAATAVAEGALAAMVAALRPGASERDLLAVYLERIAAAGAPTPPTDGVVCATPTTGPVALHRLARPEPIAAGQLVALDPGGFHRGYEGGVGRTRVAGGRITAAHGELAARTQHALAAVVAACRPGATGAEIAAAWTATGEPPPPVPLAHGVGLGMEPPVVTVVPDVGVGSGIGAGAVLAAGTVLAVTGWVAEPGVGGCLERDLVLVAEDGPQVLTTAPRGPGGEAT
jgi:Xaa-Pro dipeptidase